MEEIKLKKLNIFCIPLVFALFEAATLPIVAFFESDTGIPVVDMATAGIAVGFFGTVIAMLILNAVIRKLNIRYKNNRIKKINIIVPSLYNSFFLALLFTVESYLSFLNDFHIIYGNALYGFVTTGVSILIMLLLYNLISKKCKGFVFVAGKKFIVKRISPFTVAFFAAIYEFFALPLMAYLDNINIFWVFGPLFAFSLVGLVSGFLAGLIVVLFYNSLNLKIGVTTE